MYIHSKNPLIAFLVLFLTIANCELLLKKGTVKYHKNGRRNLIAKVPYLDSKVVNDTKYLQINGKINILARGSVRNLVQVVTLKLFLCEIKEVRPGAFVNLPRLATLSLMDNDIEHISTGVFNNLSISKLCLHRNQIKSIERDAFNDMPNLFTITLNSNIISTWDSNWFQNTPHLTEVFFRRNYIKNIPGRAFKNIKGGHYFNGTYVVDTKIYLSKNNISAIDPTAFEGIGDLKQLWLDRNSLTEIQEGLFSNMNKIGVIFLSKNHLKSIPNKLFSTMKEDLITLDLTGNRNFTCPPYDIVSRVKITTLMDIKGLDCNCVSELLDRLYKERKDNEIKTSCITE